MDHYYVLGFTICLPMYVERDMGGHIWIVANLRPIGTCQGQMQFTCATNRPFTLLLSVGTRLLVSQTRYDPTALVHANTL